MIAAIAALLLVFMVMCFVSLSPWLLFGVPPILWAVKGIVAAINGAPDDEPTTEEIECSCVEEPKQITGASSVPRRQHGRLRMIAARLRRKNWRNGQDS
ncbi:hypothetical protein CVV72_41180 (plasmid) [Amycolatopsis sp. TNS106]|nr:hypothetical protein CVV72_41180 [Amycolatopsis sp. TNS106]